MSEEESRRYCRLADSPRIHALTEILSRRLGKDLYECDVKGVLISSVAKAEAPSEPVPLSKQPDAPSEPKKPTEPKLKKPSKGKSNGPTD